MKLLHANVINAAFQYVINTSKKYNIDESHALKHSMDVFHYANKIVHAEFPNNRFLEHQTDIISISAILHDMCDKKYVNENNGIIEIDNFMKDYMNLQQREMVSNIVSTMSYSTVKTNGYPNFDAYQLAYHIVREADLLTAYDIDRCIIYGMMKENLSYKDSAQRAVALFEHRVLKYRSDNLFITDYSKQESLILHNKCLQNIESLNKYNDQYNDQA
jgi:HD superfamily phosphodiesterase